MEMKNLRAKQVNGKYEMRTNVHQVPNVQKSENTCIYARLWIVTYLAMDYFMCNISGNRDAVRCYRVR